MKLRRLAPFLLATSLAACTSAGPWPDTATLAPRAEIGEVVARELAFARAAREQGQWTAYRSFAADDAIMFVPEAVAAQDWLDGRADPPQAIAWEPHEVWSSCDGSLAVTRSGWRGPGGSVGHLTTIWQRQADNDYRWVLIQRGRLDEPLEEPEMIAAERADCSEVVEQAVGQPGGPAAGPGGFEGRSVDGTLEWSARVRPDLSRLLVVRLREDGALRDVLRSEIPAPQAD